MCVWNTSLARNRTVYETPEKFKRWRRVGLRLLLRAGGSRALSLALLPALALASTTRTGYRCVRWTARSTTRCTARAASSRRTPAPSPPRPRSMNPRSPPPWPLSSQPARAQEYCCGPRNMNGRYQDGARAPRLSDPSPHLAICSLARPARSPLRGRVRVRGRHGGRPEARQAVVLHHDDMQPSRSMDSLRSWVRCVTISHWCVGATRVHSKSVCLCNDTTVYS